MVTAATFQTSRATLHIRGNWSAREDRIASAVWLAILWIGMIAGFGTDFPRYLRESPAAPPIVHIHAAVFTTWMFLLTAQVLLVLRDRVVWHRTLGWFMGCWACLMGILGPWAAMAAQRVLLHSPNFDPSFFSVNIVDIGGFLVLLAWGIALRKNPAAHKRMMILACVSLADPGFSRFLSFIYPAMPGSSALFFIEVFYGNILLILLMASWDWWKGRLMRSFVVGAACLLAAEYVSSALYYSPTWKSMTTSWVQSWVNHFG